MSPDERKRLFRDLMDSPAWEDLVQPVLLRKMAELREQAIRLRCDLETLREAQGKYELLHMLVHDTKRFLLGNEET